MKTNKFKIVFILPLLFALSCEQEIIKTTEPEPDLTNVNPPECPDNASAGSLNLAKFIALGNSLTAGFQAGALFTAGQENSLPKIIAGQLECVGGSTTFNQPDVNSVNGCYNLAGGCTLGRLILFDPDGSGPASAGPAPAGTPGVPAPYNTADALTAYTGDKAALNNFGVPGVKLIEAVAVTNYGTLNPFYGRFATDPSSKTLLADAAEKGGTFFMMWLGANDVLKFATRGGIDNPDATGANDMTPVANFSSAYTAALTTMLGASNKGVVANIPNVTAIPFFTTVAWNTITLDAATAGALTTQLANNYNGFLSAMVTNGIITQGEADERNLAYAAGKNGVLISDETLTDLSPYMTGPAAGLLPFARARQTKANDLVCLTAGSFLGKNVDITGDGQPDGVNGVSIPLVNNTNAGTASLRGDDLVLIYEEIVTVATRIATFNGIIAAAVGTANQTTPRVALVDVNAAFNTLVANALSPAKGTTIDGVIINPTFAPPTAAFSEDGVHPNSRGYAYLANLFIDEINETFGATIPKVNIAQYATTVLPVSPAGN